MIDERIEDTVEEADEVIIDLSENEGDTPEESNNTETPVTGIETVAEETDEVEEEEKETSEEPTETEPEAEEEDTEDSKKVFGKRAEKRIKRLVAQKKELEEKLKAAEQDKASWHSQARKLEDKNKDNELSAISNYIDKLESQEKQALSALKIAKENGNIDEEITAQDTLASVKAETLVAQQYKARAQSQIQKPNEQSSPDPVIETPKQPNQYAPAPDRKAVEWQKEIDGLVVRTLQTESCLRQH
jgi:DNA repair exonuclease SbcCD ATPase subunit